MAATNGKAIRPTIAREHARQYAREGVALLGHAVNACDQPDCEYRYVDRERFLALLSDVVAFIERGEIETLTTRPTKAEQDRAFQKFMRAAGVQS